MRLLFFIFILSSSWVFAADRFTGMVSCASSGCHGGGKDNNQAIIWRRGDPVTGKRDPHHTAADILSSARSLEIGRALHISDPAKSQQCTVCHSPMESVSDKLLLKDLKPDRGVSCESCHGPSEQWLRFHTRTDVTHAQRVSAGLRDLDTAYARANTCVGCHTNISPELIAAKHPELKFEFSRQMNELPKHWKETREFSSLGLWLTGQAAVLREWSWQLSKHPDPGLTIRWKAMQWLLNQVETDSPALPTPVGELNSEEFKKVQKAADQLALRASGKSFSTAETLAQLQKLNGLSSEFRQKSVPTPELQRRAELLVFALNALKPLDSEGRPTPGVEEKLGALKALLKPGVPFDGEQFAGALEAFGTGL